MPNSALGRTAGTRDDFRAEVMGDLNGGHAHAAGTRMDEDAFAGLELCHGFQRMPRGHEHHRQRRRRLKRQSIRNGPHIAGPRHRYGCQPEHRQPEHPLARHHMGDAAADGEHHARHFVAKDAGIGRLRRIERQRLEHVAEIHPRGLHLDRHFTRATYRQGERDQPQGIEQSALAGLQPQRHRWIQHFFARLQPAVNAPDITALAAERDFPFGSSV